MPLNQKNPTLTDSWKRLKEHFNHISKQKIEDHFQTNKNRGKEFSTNFNEILFDYSKNKINKETINLFNDLLRKLIFLTLLKNILMEIILTKLSLDQYYTQHYEQKKQKRFLLTVKISFLKFYFQEKK